MIVCHPNGLLQTVKILHYSMDNFENNRITAVCRKSLRAQRQQTLPINQTPCLQVGGYIL